MPDDSLTLVLVLTGIAVFHFWIPVYVARRFAKMSGRDTFRWTLFAVMFGVLVLVFIGLVMLFGQPPFVGGIPRDVRTRLKP
jgi:thiosulfate reductase cytochrome b subunit